MEFDDIEKILALVREHELAEFELERDGLKLRVRKSQPAAPPQMQMVMPGPAISHLHQSPPSASSLPGPGSAPAAAPTDEELELAVVKSPIVGTFYRTPEPGAPAFVEVGQRVKIDQVLCIIEAMKLMNEITSEYQGEIVSVYVENGKPVQYGERVFAIKTV
ncbi:MAG: acetyl-CoA carboxylase biotin carboxyl carrier protein [Vicinamibacterales bacterium]